MWRSGCGYTGGMSHLSLIGYCYAAVLLVGGIFGYLKAKSLVSLAAGVGATAVAALAAYVAPHHPHSSEAICGLLALGMIGLFIGRYRKTKNAMPAVPMIVVSALVLAAVAYEAIKKG